MLIMNSESLTCTLDNLNDFNTLLWKAVAHEKETLQSEGLLKKV